MGDSHRSCQILYRPQIVARHRTCLKIYIIYVCVYIYIYYNYSDRGYRTMESTTNQKSITHPKHRGQEWKYDSNIPQNSGRSSLVVKIYFLKDSWAARAVSRATRGGVRVGPCLATGLSPSLHIFGPSRPTGLLQHSMLAFQLDDCDV